MKDGFQAEYTLLRVLRSSTASVALAAIACANVLDYTVHDAGPMSRDQVVIIQDFGKYIYRIDGRSVGGFFDGLRLPNLRQFEILPGSHTIEVSASYSTPFASVTVSCEITVYTQAGQEFGLVYREGDGVNSTGYRPKDGFSIYLKDPEAETYPTVAKCS